MFLTYNYVFAESIGDLGVNVSVSCNHSVSKYYVSLIDDVITSQLASLIGIGYFQV